MIQGGKPTVIKIVRMYRKKKKSPVLCMELGCYQSVKCNFCLMAL